LGQSAHAFPLLFFFFGYFLAKPSFSIIPLLIIAVVHSGAVTFLGGNLYSIKNTVRVYYDFLLRFSGCKLTEQFIDDLGLENANGKTHPIKVFHVSRNKDKNSPSPSSLCAYISDEYTPSYLFLTEPIEKMISGFQRFKLWHEIGHINQGAKDYETMINMLGLGWKSYFSILICIIINLNILSLSSNENRVLFGLLLIVLVAYSILISNIKKREWLISELEADRFALVQILRTASAELASLYEKILNKNFLYDKNVSEKENDFRRYVFLKQIEDMNFDYPKGTWREIMSAAINSISAIALIYVGTMSKRLDWVDILINFLFLIVLPLLLTIILFVFRTRGILPVLDKALTAMEKGDFVQRTFWLDITLPFLKFLNGDSRKKSKFSV
jgi:hypothetical protein